MTIEQQLQDRIRREAEIIDNHNAALPDLRERLRLAEEQADHIEAQLLLNDADTDIELAGVTQQHLMNAKREERDRRRELERTERDIRVCTVMHAELEKTLQTVQQAQVDKQLADLEQRLPTIAEDLTEAWLAYETAARAADDLQRDLKRLKQLVPVRSVRVSLSARIPKLPALERIRATHPRNSQAHPANVLRKLGYPELAARIEDRQA